MALYTWTNKVPLIWAIIFGSVWCKPARNYANKRYFVCSCVRGLMPRTNVANKLKSKVTVICWIFFSSFPTLREYPLERPFSLSHLFISPMALYYSLCVIVIIICIAGIIKSTKSLLNEPINPFFNLSYLIWIFTFHTWFEFSRQKVPPVPRTNTPAPAGTGNKNGRELYSACKNGDLEKVQEILRQFPEGGLDVDYQEVSRDIRNPWNVHRTTSYFPFDHSSQEFWSLPVIRWMKPGSQSVISLMVTQVKTFDLSQLSDGWSQDPNGYWLSYKKIYIYFSVFVQKYRKFSIIWFIFALSFLSARMAAQPPWCVRFSGAGSKSWNNWSNTAATSTKPWR